MGKKILIKLFSEIEKEILEKLKKHLEKIFKAKVKIAFLKRNLSFAFNEKRNQYLASKIIENEKKFKKDFFEKWLLIVDVDIFCPFLNFVFGLADFNSGICLISLLRLRQEFYGLPENENLFLERIKKEATHELGHLFNLGHCRDKSCVMHFSNSLIDTDIKSPFFCQKCQKILQSYLERK